jgi:hypothetical protein
VIYLDKLAMTTVTENIQARLDGFSLWSLTARYEEAMMICHLLGVRHMWIDSLCIIQVYSIIFNFTYERTMLQNTLLTKISC